MSTIKDVAKLAGVSVATVSRVLNKNGYVHEDTLKKVERAIEMLDYKPSTVARSLYNKKSRLIGLVVPNIVNPFFPEVARAVEDVAHKQGYTVVLCNSDESLEKEKQYIDVLRQNNVDGFIVATNPQNSINYMNLSVPVVAIDRMFNERIPTVYADNYAGSQDATRLLIDKGCKHIAHIRGPRDVSTANERFEGFVDIITQNNLSYMIAESTFDPANSARVAMELLEEYPHIDGIVAGNDLIAIGIVKAALQKGMAIPDDLQIIGFDGISLTEMMYPSITTVAQPIYEMGKIATELLLEQMEGNALEEKHYRLPIKIIERNTTK
ncbi:ribose operon transcriptional repressor RbsR [Bacillus cereus group sp. N11]|uniref:ribose operon transcriptional repressor RbsR n=1 Tax=Bacillus TaxID=1386 RepID=UPI000BFC3A8A|nr:MULTISPECIES: ribose operon transcriptional repressor RbsR [Bacillus]AXK16844.1 LacI family transcriptional regulator [Bacillus sp. COPE52]MBJ8075514.1 ribose operon transcriptional repressor RbsR [Bacillus cereus group sp. N12]MBJ8100158.1 ribose operon transcriptional repressor RbsR [Bacillus cereus group sp. N11]PHD50143.1 transcriptional regulator [Bacillus toyonensis]HDR7688177.1 ribose operon transcriptional repressor RbsR [Bacillus toyonensis]